MSEVEDRSRIDQIVAMATALADQVLKTHASGQPFEEQQLEALAVAARFLLENEILWPPVVEEAIEILADHLDEVKNAEPHPR